MTDDLDTTATPSEDASVFAQGARYLLVGGSSAALEIAIFWILSNPMHLDVKISNVIAVVIATICNFAMNRAWTFNATSHVMRSAVLYLTLWSLNLVFTTTTIALAASHGFNPTLVKLGTMAMVTLWNFQLFRKVIFV